MKKIKKCTAHNLRLWITDVILMLFGAILYALGVNFFLAPNEIATGGATGIATMLNFLTGFPIGTAIFIINIPLFIIAHKKFGVRFIIKTVAATVLCSVLIDASALFLPSYKGSGLLSAGFGGVLLGFGMGLIFLRGGTTGGSDILAKLIKLKKPHLSLGTTIFLCDAVIVAFTFIIYRSIESLMYSSIVFFVSSKAIDYLVFGASRSKMLLIVTTKEKSVTKRIFDEIHHGVTVIPALGAYSGDGRKILMSVVRPNEAAKITKIAKTEDPDSFTVITDATEVYGLGFENNTT